MYYPKNFEYESPNILKEALDLLEKYQQDAKVLAGGQSLIPLMKLRVLSPKIVIDINKLSELSYIKEDDNYINIGALTRHNEVLESELLSRYAKALVDAAKNIADHAIRNMGTIGGNVCHSDPAADYLPVVLALEALLLTISNKGKRTLKADEFLMGPFETSLLPDELLLEIKIPKVKGRVGSSFLKFPYHQGDISLINVATLVKIDENKVVKDCRIAVGGILPKPERVKGAEDVIVGKKVEDKDIVEASKIASETLNPQSDWMASSEYRRALIATLVENSLNLSLERAGARI
ncbi:MAG: xanthine dehydrogenase family protein subunit M [Nitrososphaerales archaeon]